MDNRLVNEKVQAIADVIDALMIVKKTIEENVIKCNRVTEDKWKEIYTICKQVKDVLQILQIENELFENLYFEILEITLGKEEAKESEYVNMLSQLTEECIKTLNEQLVFEGEKNGKKVIKIKYIDFYPEFQPKEHWLYKVLIKKYYIAFSDTPDYLFFSCFGNQYLKYDCIRIFISNEAVYPNLNLYDYSVTYSDFKITDRLLPNQDAFEDLKCKKQASSMDESLEMLKQKKEFCNFVYSNGEGDPFRKELFDAISQYKTVLAGGRFLNNIGYRVNDLQEFQSKFKFSIACENSLYKGYTTEKIINAFNAGTIPIYWGNPDVAKVINSKAIINCHDFPDVESIVEEIKRLDNDDEAYAKKLMEPILVNDNLIEDYLEEREKFIYNIIEQPYESAFRRNRGLRGQWYNDFFCYILGYPNEWFTAEKGYFVK